jgi:hypothetical protein
MRNLKVLAVAAAVLGGAVTLSGAASAAPVAAGGIDAGHTLAEPVQYWGPGYGHRRPYYGRRGYWRPPVVCRFRPSPWGPRRVCFRRY